MCASIGVPVFVLYSNDCSSDNVQDFIGLLRYYGINADTDLDHIDKNPNDWSLLIEKQLQNCVHHNGLIILMWSTGLKIPLQDEKNRRIEMSSGHIFRASLRTIIQEFLDHFVLVSFDPVSWEDLPPYLRNKTVYNIPIATIPDDTPPSDIADLNDLVATVYNRVILVKTVDF